jgi:hypothetical protein
MISRERPISAVAFTGYRFSSKPVVDFKRRVMDQSELQKLELTNPIIQVAIELGIKVHGNMGRCFRNERHSAADQTMTLFFNSARNTFFCKACGDIGGSVIDLVSQYRNLSHQEAIDWLTRRSDFDRQTRERYNVKGRKKT